MARELAAWATISDTLRVDALIRGLNAQLRRMFEHVARLQRMNVRAASAATTLTDADDVLLVNTTSGAVTVTLPPAASARRDRPYIVKKINAGANNVTLDGDGAETIDGAASVVWNTQWQVTRVVSDGSAWYTV